ncbi:MAG: Rhs element Vgr protein, partial [Nitrospinaceae bacterium]|nr:phage late control D family protein [Nitrospinaceae bacterium]NIR57108.1 phage late control D family protein [Nitrospinaceae bacterium]NIS87549.1 phage late control D family protein [Nitrospinaceae bacterium]NIT84419.1 phage late control D family protein [Nitrospinaceae bacterium]NIU46606.1 phage late control D family protein [Nitrospinaceae bacterium]
MIGESAPQNSDLTTFTLKVEGQPLPDTYRISSIDISREFGRIASASIVLLDGDSSKQTFEVSSEEHLVPGKSIEIFGGYSSDENLMFKGTIVTQNIKMRKPGESYLYVECRDAAYRMTLARRSRYFKDVSYSEMFEEIAAGYPEVNIETKPTTEKHPEKVQFRISDWDFLVAQAENAGLHCLTLDGKIKIFKPDEIPEPALNLSYGVNVFDLDLEMDSRLQFSEVKASSWDASQQQLLDADIDDVTTPSQGNIPATELAQTHGDLIFELKHSGRLSQQELDGWVEAQM